MVVTIPESVNNFLKVVSQKIDGFSKAYLFGSFAEGKNHEDSDIDIAIVIEGLKDSDRFDLQVKLLLLASEFDGKIEPHPISSADFSPCTPFAKQIISTGIEL